MTMANPLVKKPGISVEIPGFATLNIKALCTDYTGTLALEGSLIEGVKPRFRILAEMLDIFVVTSDTRGTARIELSTVLPLRGLEDGARATETQEFVTIIKPKGSKAHDLQKKLYLTEIIRQRQIALKNVVVLGNGRNDVKWLRKVHERGGLAIAVDVGEGCSVEAMNSAHIFISGICNALDLLLDTDRLKGTLRTE